MRSLLRVSVFCARFVPIVVCIVIFLCGFECHVFVYFFDVHDHYQFSVTVDAAYEHLNHLLEVGYVEDVPSVLGEFGFVECVAEDHYLRWVYPALMPAVAFVV